MARLVTRNLCTMLTVFTVLLSAITVLADDAKASVVDGVEEATKSNFGDYLKSNEYLLVLFYESGCETCEEAKVTIGHVEKPDIFPGVLKKIKISDNSIANSHGAAIFPAFVLFRSGSPVVFDGESQDEESIETWLEIAHEEATKELTDDSFEHLTQASTGATTGDWMVAFYGTSCSSILSVLESFGVRIKRKMNVAKVIMDSNPRLVKRMKVTKCPTLIFYRQGKMYRYEVEKYDTKSLTSFVSGWYQNMKAESIPVDPSGFDELTENIAKALKNQIEGPNRQYFLAIVGGGTALIVVIVVLAVVMSRRSAQQKKKLY